MRKMLFSALFMLILAASLSVTASAQDRFIGKGDGTVTDSNTGLIWQKEQPSSIKDWSDAVSYCDSLTLGGSSDWRLPTKPELEGIMTATTIPCLPVSAVHLDPAFGCNGATVWSATECEDGNAYFAAFADPIGLICGSKTGGVFAVRCVMAAQSSCSLKEEDCPHVCADCALGYSGGGCSGGLDKEKCTCKETPKCTKITIKPYCWAIGSRSEGWHDNSGSIRYDNCAKCLAECDAAGTKSEGWYSSCDGKLIKYDECEETPESVIVKEQVKCVFLKVSVAATTSVAGSSAAQTAAKPIAAQATTQTTQSVAIPVAAQATTQSTKITATPVAAQTTTQAAQKIAIPIAAQDLQKCYTDDGRFGCSGAETCVADVSGEKGKMLTWKSSCGGYAYTTIDSVDEYAKFTCIEQSPINTCPALMRPYCPNGTLVSQGNDEKGCPLPSKCISENVCPSLYEPVCGSDRNTYSNKCIAEYAGVKWTEGVCRGTDTKECNGCMLEGKCLPYGYRYSNENLEPVQYNYCDIIGDFKSQRSEGSSCQNNYECTSNQCSNGHCLDIEKQLKETQGMLDKIMGWFRSIFGVKVA